MVLFGIGKQLLKSPKAQKGSDFINGKCYGGVFLGGYGFAKRI